MSISKLKQFNRAVERATGDKGYFVFGELKEHLPKWKDEDVQSYFLKYASQFYEPLGQGKFTRL